MQEHFDFCTVVTCMGRWEFVRQTAPRILDRSDIAYCLVDYSCPDEVGDRVLAQHPEAARSGRLIVERVSGRTKFNKCEALNAGARRAASTGARFLCFLDADTVVEPEYFDWVRAHAAPGRFLVSALNDGHDVPSLTGALVVSAEEFGYTRGFDEEFRGWGGEDVEFRLRLHLLHGLSYDEIPLSAIRALPHDDNLRARYYDQKDVVASNAENAARIASKMARWRGFRSYDARTAERLFYQ
jgi:hypothetical protein